MRVRRQGLARQLETSKVEYLRLCGHGATIADRVAALRASLADEGAAEAKRREEASAALAAASARRSEAAIEAQRARTELKEKRESWAKSLEGRQRRKGLEEGRVASLSERFASELNEIARGEEAASVRIRVLDEKLAAVGSRLAERQAALAEVEALRMAKRDELMVRPCPVPWPWLPPSPLAAAVVAQDLRCVHP